MQNQQIKIRCRGIIVHDGKLLLVKHSHGADFYALPGGHLDFGEDPMECIAREMVEELGIVPVIGRLLYVYSFVNSEGKQSVEFHFEIKNGADFLAHAEKEKSHAFEIVDVVWADQSTSLRILPEEIGKAFKAGKLFEDQVRFIKG